MSPSLNITFNALVVSPIGWNVPSSLSVIYCDGSTGFHHYQKEVLQKNVSRIIENICRGRWHNTRGTGHLTSIV